jgi:hypothetical protein
MFYKTQYFQCFFTVACPHVNVSETHVKCNRLQRFFFVFFLYIYLSSFYAKNTPTFGDKKRRKKWEKATQKKYSESWQVTEANCAEYFNSKNFLRKVSFCMLEDSQKEVIFNLNNGDFVKMESN